MAEKALQNNYYLESYTTAPEHRQSSRDAGYFFPRVCAESTPEDPVQSRGGGVATGGPTGAQARCPAKGPPGQIRFFFKALEARGSDQRRRQERREGVPERTNNA